MDKIQITQDVAWVVADPEALLAEIDNLKLENEQLHSILSRMIQQTRKLQMDNANLRNTVSRLVPDNPASKPRRSTARFEDVFEGAVDYHALQELVDNAQPQCCPSRMTLTGGA